MQEKEEETLKKLVEKFREKMFYCEKCNAYITLLNCKARKKGDFRRFLNQEGNVTDFSIDSINYCKNECMINVDNVDYEAREFTVEDLSKINKEKNFYRKSKHKNKEEKQKRMSSLRGLKNA